MADRALKSANSLLEMVARLNVPVAEEVYSRPSVAVTTRAETAGFKLFMATPTLTPLLTTVTKV